MNGKRSMTGNNEVEQTKKVCVEKEIDKLIELGESCCRSEGIKKKECDAAVYVELCNELNCSIRPMSNQSLLVVFRKQKDFKEVIRGAAGGMVTTGV